MSRVSDHLESTQAPSPTYAAYRTYLFTTNGHKVGRIEGRGLTPASAVERRMRTFIAPAEHGYTPEDVAVWEGDKLVGFIRRTLTPTPQVVIFDDIAES